MRERIVLSIIVGLFVVFGVLVAGRFRGPPSVGSNIELAVSAAVAATNAGSSTGADVAVGAARAASAVEPERLARPVRVVGTGWELLAPGVVANDGVGPAAGAAFAEEELEVSFRVAARHDELREALALGGESERGADIVVMSLPAFAASYETLRALDPTVFYVVGWSRGNQVVAATHRNALTGKSAPKAVVDAPAPTPDHYFALLMLQLAGVDATQVRFATAEPGRDEVAFAVAKGEGRERLISTADASRAVVYVAVTSQGFLHRHRDEVQAWTRAWSRGRARLGEDVPAAARMIASADKSQKAYDLIERLSAVELASVADNARLVGLSGRPGITLDRHFEIAWQVFRDVGLVTTPAPPVAPVSTATIIALARADVDHASRADATKRAWSTRTPILVHRLPSDTEHEAIAAKLGLIAEVFSDSALELCHGSAAHGDEVADQAAQRFDLDRARIRVTQGKRHGDAVVITVYAAL